MVKTIRLIEMMLLMQDASHLNTEDQTTNLAVKTTITLNLICGF